MPLYWENRKIRTLKLNNFINRQTHVVYNYPQATFVVLFGAWENISIIKRIILSINCFSKKIKSWNQLTHMFSNQRNNHVYGAWEKYWCNQFNFRLVNHFSISFVSHKSETKYLLLCNSYQHFFFFNYPNIIFCIYIYTYIT